MLETMKYIRKPFFVDAVRVTHQNINDVAAWASGEVRTDSDGQYIKVRVQRPLNDRQTKAYVGDWVLYAGSGYKVYNDKAFRNSFDQHSVETTMHITPADSPGSEAPAPKKNKKAVPAPPATFVSPSEEVPSAAHSEA